MTLAPPPVPPTGPAVVTHRPIETTVRIRVPVPVPPPARTGGRHTRPAVLVTGAGGPAGVAVVRHLVASGHRVVAVDADPHAAGGALADASATVPRGDHPGYASALLAVAVRHGCDALVPTVAEELPALRTAAPWLSAHGLASWLPDERAVQLCCDKELFARRMVAAGVAHPATATRRDVDADVPGPWVVKPRSGRGSRGVQLLDDPAAVRAALAADPDLVVQTRLTGREFTADALVDRDGELLTVVPRWRTETRAGISVKGTTFASVPVTELVQATLAAVGLTGPANVQGYVAEDGTATVMEVNPRFSGGLPLTLAAGADVVGTYLTGVRAPGAALPRLWFTPGVRMSRYFAETFTGPDGVALPALPASAPAHAGARS